jgi:hypothetical protein
VVDVALRVVVGVLLPDASAPTGHLGYTDAVLQESAQFDVVCDAGGERPIPDADDAGSAPAEDVAPEGAEDLAPEGAEDAGVDGASGETAFLLTDWVYALVEERSSHDAEPDTVEDKRIINTDDPSVFDTYL